jgi:hypothetical protein
MYILRGRQRAKNRKKDKYLQQNLRHVHVHYIPEVKTRWAGIVVRMVYRRGVWRCLVGRPKGKRQLRRPKLRWEHNMKIDLQDVGSGGMDWIDLAQDWERWKALVNVVRNHRVP